MYIDRVVNSSFGDRQKIDLFFISHFDKDHVNGIKALISHKRHIDYVVIPQINSYEWFFVMENAIAYGEHNVSDANRVYGLTSMLEKTGAKVIQVRPITGEGNRNEESPNQEDIPDVERVFNRFSTIDSGKAMGIVSNPLWIYIPVNYTYDKDIKALENGLNAIMKKDAKYNNKDIVSFTANELCEFITAHRKEINDVYNSIFPSTNASSLCVFSTVARPEGAYECTIRFTGTSWPLYSYLDDGYWFWHEINNREGCLYTGDSSMSTGHHMLKTQFLLNVINPWVKHLGLLQLPHHGSKDNFGKDTMNRIISSMGEAPLLCFASFGTNNTYGHP